MLGIDAFACAAACGVACACICGGGRPRLMVMLPAWKVLLMLPPPPVAPPEPPAPPSPVPLLRLRAKRNQMIDDCQKYDGGVAPGKLKGHALIGHVERGHGLKLVLLLLLLLLLLLVVLVLVLLVLVLLLLLLRLLRRRSNQGRDLTLLHLQLVSEEHRLRFMARQHPGPPSPTRPPSGRWPP